MPVEELEPSEDTGDVGKMTNQTLFPDDVPSVLRDVDFSVMEAELRLGLDDLEEQLLQIEQSQIVTQELLQMEFSI